MAADLTNLHPAVAFELSDEFPHLHDHNVRTGCDIWSCDRQKRCRTWIAVASDPAVGGTHGTGPLNDSVPRRVKMGKE